MSARRIFWVAVYLTVTCLTVSDMANAQGTLAIDLRAVGWTAVAVAVLAGAVWFWHRNDKNAPRPVPKDQPEGIVFYSADEWQDERR